jgi:20S proteasome alpha/beta subunit
MQLLGSNFQVGDTLTFTDPQGDAIPNARAITVKSGNEIDYQFDDASAAGNWTVRVNSSSGHSSPASFVVSGGAATSGSGIDYRLTTSGAASALIGVNVAAIVADHYSFVGEYIGNTANRGYLTHQDALTLSQNNISIVTLFERAPDTIGYFTAAQADSDATDAITAAENVVQQPKGTVIYFTIDPGVQAGVYSGSGPLPASYITAIDNYFTELSNDFATAGNPYQIGVYGAGDALTSIRNLNLNDVNYYWVDNHWGGTSFSGANLTRGQNQTVASPTPIGVAVDTDTSNTANYGQWSFLGTNSSVSVVESFGSTELVQAGNNFFLYSLGGSTGPELKLSGTPVTAGQFVGNWTPLGAEATASGYEVAWENVGANQYTVWSTDSSGNYLSNLIGLVSGSSTALEALEPSFSQDLNADGTIGVPGQTTTVIESFGSTKLVAVGNNYFLYPVGGSTGPELKLSGTPVTAGQFVGNWTPLGAEATASGYEVAWENVGANQYTVWSTDSSGNYLSNLIGLVSGSSTALEALEPSFSQDLNADGTIGVPGQTTTVIESFGSTKLVAVGNNYFLYPVGGSTGPELKLSGTPVTAGQFVGNWTPLGAEATASGYEVAWENVGANQYTVWSTDGSGNYLSNLIGLVSGSSTALEALEPSFHQDLNGDGTIGASGLTTPMVVESFGSAELVQVGNNFFLYPVGGSSGPELKLSGTPVTAGQFVGNWTPLGAEATASGYEVAWENVGANQYTVWSTDGSGNYLSNLIGLVSGSSTALEALEPSFHQDLNGDGTIGLPAQVIESFGSTELVENGSNFFFYPVSGSSGPELKLSGTPVTAGQFVGNWTPLGVEATANGYEVAWENVGANQYTVWSTDHNGNYLSNIIGVVSGSDSSLEKLEPTFDQDLNSDGTIGLPTSTFANDITNAESLINGQIDQYTSAGAAPPASAFHLTDDSALVDQIANDVAALYGTPQGNYTIGTAANTNSSSYPSSNRGITNGFINVSSELPLSTDNQFLDQCVALVQALDKNLAPSIATTLGWRPGVQVVGSNGAIQNIAPGTPIATFTGTSYNQNHAAIFLGAGVEDNVAGFFVLDQYNIPPLKPDGTPLNGSTYEPAELRFISEADPNISQYFTIALAGASVANDATTPLGNPSFQQDLNADGVIGIHATPANNATPAIQPLPATWWADDSGSALAATAGLWGGTETALGGQQSLWEGSILSDAVPPLSSFFSVPEPMADVSPAASLQAGVASVLSMNPLQHSV